MFHLGMFYNVINFFLSRDANFLLSNYKLNLKSDEKATLQLAYFATLQYL